MVYGEDMDLSEMTVGGFLALCGAVVAFWAPVAYVVVRAL